MKAGGSFDEFMRTMGRALGVFRVTPGVFDGGQSFISAARFPAFDSRLLIHSPRHFGILLRVRFVAKRIVHIAKVVVRAEEEIVILCFL